MKIKMIAPEGKQRGLGDDGKMNPDPEGIFRTDDHLPWNHYDELQKVDVIFEDNVQHMILVGGEDYEIEEEFWLHEIEEEFWL